MLLSYGREGHCNNGLKRENLLLQCPFCYCNSFFCKIAENNSHFGNCMVDCKLDMKLWK